MISTDLSYLEKLKLLEIQMHLQFGKRIVNNNDCNNLNAEVFNKTGKLLSSQTFRRFFKLIKADGNLSQSTANIMCQYCGYQNLDHLASKHIELVGAHSSQYHEAQIYKSFFEVQVPKIAKGELNQVYFNAISNVLKKVYQDKLLYDTLIPLISENSTAHNYLFEQFPYLDGFGRGYEQGYNLYLRHKPEVEAQVFGNAMLFLSSILLKEFSIAKVYYDNLAKNDLQLLRHPFVIARYIGTQILYHHINGHKTEKKYWIEQIKLKLQEDVNRHGFQPFNIEFELVISKYLLLAESFNLVIDILLPVYQNQQFIDKDLDRGFWLTPVEVMLIRSFTYTKRFKEARGLLLKMGTLNWLVNDYFSIQLLDAQHKMALDTTEKSEIRRKIHRLILKTNFKYFEDLV